MAQDIPALDAALPSTYLDRERVEKRYRRMVVALDDAVSAIAAKLRRARLAVKLGAATREAYKDASDAGNLLDRLAEREQDLSICADVLRGHVIVHPIDGDFIYPGQSMDRKTRLAALLDDLEERTDEIENVAEGLQRSVQGKRRGRDRAATRKKA